MGLAFVTMVERYMRDGMPASQRDDGYKIPVTSERAARQPRTRGSRLVRQNFPGKILNRWCSHDQ
jgi:hypothetical protein